MNLQLPLPCYHSLLFMIKAFIIEAVFISEQINQCRFGALLEISDTLSSKLNFLVI